MKGKSGVTTERRPPLKRISVLTLVILALFADAARAQSQNPLLPGPKPPDAPADWKRFVGIYEYSSYGKQKQNVIILERDQRAYMHYTSGPNEELHFDLNLKMMFVPDAAKGSWGYGIIEEPGSAPYFTYLNESYVRKDPGAEPARAFRITPLHPISQLRAQALRSSPPSESGPFRKPDVVALAPLESGIHLDIRYATSNDFLGTPVYSQARAFLQRPAAEALLRVQQKLKPLGYGLLIHDAYRPWYVTKIFWDATPPEGKIFVADPAQGSRHNRGCAVDLTLYDLASGKPIEMPGTYDEMSPRSFPNYPGGTSLQRWHRDLLRRAMESEGFAVYEAEWRHFDYQDWREYPILNVPFEKLDSGSGATLVH